MTHAESDACPFKDDGHPVGMLATCCSFRGNAVALYFMAMGLGPLALGLFEDKSPEECIKYAVVIRKTVKRFRQFAADVARDRSDVSDEAALVAGLTMKIPDVDWELSAEKALTAFESLADWHEKIGHMNFGVRAWF